MKNCTPLSGLNQIPTGQRACRFWTLTCPECRKRQILAEDFLRVRDTEVVELREFYEYAQLESLLRYAQNHHAE